jgi:hypothetical protein
LFPWNNVPKGGEEQMRQVAKWFFYAIIGVASVIGILYLWKFLAELFGESDQAKTAGKATNWAWDTLSSIGIWALAVLPWLILLVILIVIAILAGRWSTKSHYRSRAKRGVKYLRILPSYDTELDLDKISELTRTFGSMIRPIRMRIQYGRPWFRWRFAIPEGSNQIGIYLAYPEDKENSVKDTLRSVYPSAELHDIKEEEFPTPKKGGIGGHFIFKFKTKGYPLTSLLQSKQSQLGSILNCLRSGTYLDLQFSPVSWRAVEERSGSARSLLTSKKNKDMGPEERIRRAGLIQRLTGRELSFQVRLSIWSNHENAEAVVRSTAESVQTAMKYDGELRFIRQPWWNPMKDNNLVPIPWPLTLMAWTSDEISSLFHLPPANHYIYRPPAEDGPNARGYVAHLQENERTLEPGELTEGVKIGKLKHPFDDREVRVNFEQLNKHFVLTGASGMGKSSVAMDMVQSLLDEWFDNPDESPGFTIIDPAKELVAIIENRLRIAEKFGVKFPREKIHHLNLSDDTTQLPALNMLHRPENVTPGQMAHQLATILVDFEFKEESIERSRRLVEIAVQSLLEDEETHTILGIDDLFRNHQFREKVVKNVQDPYIKRFWANTDEQEIRREVEPVLYRLDRILQHSTLRRLFCQKGLSLDPQKYMDEGHIVLIDTNGIKDYNLRVLVGYLINLYYQAARKRSTSSKFHLMLVEEAHMIQIPLITEILQEDKKYPFGLGLVTREIDHFENHELMQAIRSYIGMVISCGQTEGSDEVESLTRKYIKTSLVESLPERNAAVYIRSKRKGRSDVTTCVVTNEPPVVYRPDGKPADHRTAEKDEAMNWGLEWGLNALHHDGETRPIEQVDKEISDYMDRTLYENPPSENAN